MLLFDRGFRRASLIRHLQVLEHERFIIRLMAKVRVQSSRWAGLLRNYPLRPGRMVDLGPCRLRADGAVTTRIIGVWQRGEDEPWWLATGLTESARQVVSLYDRRTSVEHQFRDGKGARYGAQMKWTHFQRPESLDRLWLLWALSSPVWTVAGLLAFDEDHTVLLFSRAKGPRRSLLSIGTQSPQHVEKALRLSWRLLLLLLPQAVLRDVAPGGGKR